MYQALTANGKGYSDMRAGSLAGIMYSIHVLSTSTSHHLGEIREHFGSEALVVRSSQVCIHHAWLRKYIHEMHVKGAVVIG